MHSWMTAILSMTKIDTYFFKGWMAAIRMVKLDYHSKNRMLKIDVPEK